MRLCPQCGAPMRDADDFCGNCGTYLGWAAGAADAATAAGLAGAAGVAGAADVAGAAGLAGAGGVAGLAGAAGLAGVTGVAGLADAAGSWQPPPLAELGPEGRPGPVPPGRPVARRPRPTTLDEEVVVGPPCPSCGIANPPGRRFCRRCATPLSSAVVKERGPGRRRLRWHGDTSRWLRRLVAIAAAAVVLLAGIVFYPKALALIEDLRDKTATPVAVGPSSSTATAEVAGHPAAAAVDGLSNRYWGANAVGDSVEFGFATPFRLLSVVVHTGAGVEEKAFLAQARVSALDMVVTAADGVNRTIPLPLADRVGPQRVDTAVSGVVRVRLVVRAAAGLEPGRHIALGEVEFFRRP